MNHPFIVGEVYNRREDVHGRFSGQQQGGISTPAAFPFVFAFTNRSGEAFGYEDKFKPDGTFWYTGEGQVGDMKMTRGNAAIARHEQRRKRLLVFESTHDDQIRFLGEAECLGHHTEQRPDRNGLARQAIVFHLGFLSEARQEPPAGIAVGRPAGELRAVANRSLNQLRARALAAASRDAPREQKLANVAARAEAIRKYALARANGICESCRQPAPFKTRKGPFLEVHHVFRLADGGPDHPAGVVALCPNCHRRSHYASDFEAFNLSLSTWLVSVEGARDAL